MRRRLAGVLLGLMVALMLMPVASASAVVGYYVSGTVVDGAGIPVDGAYVELWDDPDDYTQFGETVETGPDGRFSIGPVANGDYIVELTDFPVNMDDPSWWAYTYVTVNGANVTGVEVIDAPEPAAETGTVTVHDDLTGLPVGDAEVSSDEDGSATDADGVCDLAVTDGVVTVDKEGYVEQTFTGLAVGENRTVSLTLDAGYGLLHGTIADEASDPIERDILAEGLIEGSVHAFDAEMGEYIDVAWFQGASDGSFCAPVLEGDVFVDFFDQQGEYAYELYQDARFISDATSIAITAAAATPIAPKLGAGTAVSGDVTSSGGWTALSDYAGQYIEAWALSETDARWMPVVTCDAIGPNYTLAGLPAGDYKIMIHTILADSLGNPVVLSGQPVYTDAWYKPGAALQFTDENIWDKLWQAETVTVTAGQEVEDIDFVLSPRPDTVSRIAGTSRYDVAVNLARKGWDPCGDKSWDGVTDVIVACGDNGKEADPLAAAGLAGMYDCPVLLTGVTSLPSSTKTAITEIAKKNPQVKIHLIGGVNSVPDARWNTIKAIPGVDQTKDRIYGQSRYDVSAAIATRMINEMGPDSFGGVLIVAGDNTSGFYDALAASPIAFANSMPILSVQKGVVPNSVANLLDDELFDVPRYVVNSSTYVSDATKNNVDAEANRLATSSNRYTAASQIAVQAINREWLTCSSTAVAAKLPDALTGGIYSGRNGGVMLFTDSTYVLQTATKSFITTRKAGIHAGWVLGGTVSVPTAQENSFGSLVQ